MRNTISYSTVRIIHLYRLFQPPIFKSYPHFNSKKISFQLSYTTSQHLNVIDCLRYE
jgi:hypothetical protein